MKFTKNYSLHKLNTFGLNVQAELFAELTEIDELHEIIDENTKLKHRLFILGEGSNILLTRNIDGICIHNRISGIDLLKEDNENVWIKAFSGEIWHQLVLFCVNKNLGGVENLSLIPGTVGAAPIQNIGAYGVELKDTLVSVECIDLNSGNIISFTNDECNFGYRSSVFKSKYKNHFFIYSVTLKLSKSPVFNVSYGTIEQELNKMGISTLTTKAVSDAVINIRKSKLPDPAFIGNAGSFFKNPEISKEDFKLLKEEYPTLPFYPGSDNRVKIPAAWLIEQCGWKGKRAGNTGMHKNQALVLVNYGSATGMELLTHANTVQESVKSKFNISMEMEVNVY